MFKGKLSSLPPGESARIDSINCGRAVRCRLTDLGMIKNFSVTCLMKSLGGGISAYRIGRTVIAIRREDADYINIF